MAFRLLRRAPPPHPIEPPFAVAGIFGAGPRYVIERTVRTLRALGVAPIEVRDGEWPAALARGARWFVRAGAVPTHVPARLSPSSTRMPAIALGAPEGASDLSRAIAETGGDLSRREDWATLPFTSALLCERMAEMAAASPIAEGPPFDARVPARVVHDASLDAPIDLALRVAEVVTSLQIGGAERVAHTLATELPRAEIAARIFALGRPTRERLPGATSALELHTLEPDMGRRVARLVAEALAWGADVAHVHLAGDDVIDALAAAGLPVAVTIHNAREGWPAGTAALDRRRVRVVVGCAIAVDRALRDAGVDAPIRAIQNGVIEAAPARASREDTRAAWGATPEDVVLLVAANPRPQKRFDRVAPIASALAARVARPVRVVWCGAPSERDETALAIARSVRADLAAAGVPLVTLGAVTHLAPVYAAADALLSTSDWEGLSLAQLEALAHGLPVIATDVGGTAELAAASSGGVRLVAPDAPPRRYVDAIAHALERPRPEPTLPSRFTARSMTRAYARLLREAARAPDSASAPLDVVLVTNNLAPGGAQSSARRLLGELHRRGRRVLAVTVEEHPERPTPGCAALAASGVEVISLPPALDATRAVRLLFDEVEARGGARAFALWNLIAEHKLLIADGALDARVVDVSPGEMYFSSLARFFEADRRPDVGCASALDYGRLLDAVVVKYEDERARAEEVLGRPAHVIPNGVALAAPRSPRADGVTRFGTSIRIHPHKRVDLLLAAFDRMWSGLAPDARDRVELAILGTHDRGCEAHLEALVAASAHLPVRWLGFSEDVGAFLSSLDAFILVAEPAGCPNASLEALAHGLPTIATDVGGIREQLGDGAGIVVGRTDVAELATAMGRVHADLGLRERLSRGALTRVEARFGLRRMADAYERLLLAPKEAHAVDSG